MIRKESKEKYERNRIVSLILLTEIRTSLCYEARYNEMLVHMVEGYKS